MERSLGQLEEALPVRRAQVLQPHLAAGRGDADLSAVQVPCEDQVELARCERPHVVREVHEQDAEVRVRVGQRAVRLPVAPRIAPGHLDPPAVVPDAHGLVLQEHRRVHPAQVGGTAEGIPGRSHVVVPEHGVGAVAWMKPAELPPQRAHAALPADEVAGDGDEVELLRRRPVDGLAEGAAVQRDGAEVEVGDVQDPQAVELRRETLHGRVALQVLDPLRLEERPRESGRRDHCDGDEEPGHLSSLELAPELQSPARAAVLRGVSGGAPASRSQEGGGTGGQECEDDESPGHR